MMKFHWTLGLAASLVVSAWAGDTQQGVSLASQAAPATRHESLGKNTILLGGKGLTVERAAQASQGVAKVLRKLSNGLILVEPTVDQTQAMNTIRRRGISHVVESSAAFIDKTSLTSVKRHRKYLQAFGADYFEALEHYLAVRVGPDGKMNREAILRANEQRERLPAAPWNGSGANNPMSTFTHIGPTNVAAPYSTYYGIPPLSGRKNDLAVSPSNPAIMYVASAGGGIWKTVDSGVNWTPLSDKWAFLHVSSVAVHPTNPNIVVAGTGDYNGFFGAQTQGMMRSTDGGLTWTQVGPGTIKNEIVTKIMFDPATPSNVIAVSGKGPTAELGGIYRSTDAGATWSRSSFGWNFEDMDRGPSGVYWVTGTDGGLGGVAYSSNLGITWTVVTNPCINAQQSLDIACSKVNANVVYLLATGDEEIYKTTNGGNSWGSVKGNFPNGYPADPNYNWSQKTYDQWIGTTVIGGVDVVLVGLIGINQSVGGTGTWSDISQTYAQSPPNYIHSDQHMFAVNPSNPAIMYFGCDGGLFRYTYSANPVAANFASLNATIKDMQLYQMSLHPSNQTYIMSGTQDNSSPSSRGNMSAWSNLYAGDGGWSGFDRNNPNIHYTTSQGGSVWRYTTANDPTPDYIKPSQFNGLFIAPFVVGGNGSQIFMGDTRVLRWTGAGQVWNDISGAVAGGGKITTMSLSQSNAKFLYTGSNNGTVYMSLNIDAASPTFKRVDNGTFGSRPIGATSGGTGNFYDCLVGLQGQGANRLYRCTNTNAVSPVWTNVTGNAPYNLPDSPVNAIARDPYHANTWYVGMDNGLYMTTNAGVSWYNMNTLGLPNVHVNALHIDTAKLWLYVGTYGRGIYRMPLTANPVYSISGTVRKVDNSFYSGVTLYLQKFREQFSNFVRNPNLAIPDNDPNGVTDSMNVAINQPIKKIAINLNITHTFRGDLRITLIGPDGHQHEIFGTSGDSGDNIIGTFDVGNAFNGLSTQGTWQLKVADEGPQDIGTLNSWKLTFFYDIYGTVQTKTTDVNGNYSFTGLDAGQYKWYPYIPGKTWTPGWRTSNIGISKTGQDFKANN